MDRHIEIKIYDSCCDLPECRWKGMIVDFEKEFAVKTYAVFAYIQDEMVGFMRVLRNPDREFKKGHTSLECFKQIPFKRLYRRACH